jgi:hypothetical protein
MDLLDLIEIGKVVPIVGRSMSQVVGGGDKPVSFETAVSERLAAELGLDTLPSGWGLNELYLSIADKNAYSIDTFHPKLKRVLRAMTPHLEPLRKIAAITHFNLFLSTAIDGFLEQAVREVRGTNSRESVSSYTFAPGFQSAQRPLAQPGDVCVFNLLGSQATCPSWAVTVEGMVEFVLGLQNEKYRPDHLFDALKDRHVLAIGCKIPDWLGRFFLRSLRDGPISGQPTASFLVDDARDADVAFAQYLGAFSKKSYVVSDNAFAFVDELNRRWQERFGDAPTALPVVAAREAAPASAGKVFISYSHADRDVADGLYEHLRSRRIDVWKDDRDDALEKGANWDNEIKRRIADCACFVPLITRNTISVSESFFWNEWNQALKRRMQMDGNVRRFIFPVLSEPGVTLPEQFSEMQWTIWSDPGDREAFAAALRKEQQSQRKDGR